MNYRKVTVFFCFWLWSSSGFCARPPELPLRVVTENFPPYNYLTAEGELAGVMNHIIQELLTRLDSKQPIEVLPWARAYQTALTEPNTLIYSIVKTPVREDKFHWLISFLSLDINVYSLPGTYKGKIKDLKEVQQQSIGIMRASSHENYIRQHFRRDKQHVTTNISYLHLYQMLQLKRLDLIVAPSRLIRYLNQQQQTPVEKRPEAIFKLPFPFQKKLYIALSKKTPDHRVEKVKQTLIAMEDDGTIAKIIKKHHPPAVSH